jgi:predicted MFS family arabinose efflux permease
VGLLATRWGWRSVYLCSTALALFFGAVIVLFLRADDRFCLSGDCIRNEDASLDKQGMDVGRIVRSARFWFLMLTGFLIGVAATGSYLIFPSHAQQDGLSLIFVTSVLGVTMPIGNIIGKLVFGTLTDRWGAGRAALIPFGANLVGVVAAVFMEPSTASLAVVASLGIGFGYPRRISCRRCGFRSCSAIRAAPASSGYHGVRHDRQRRHDAVFKSAV